MIVFSTCPGVYVKCLANKPSHSTKVVVKRAILLHKQNNMVDISERIRITHAYSGYYQSCSDTEL